MLSAFKTQAIHELKPRDKSKIESLLAYGDRLLVGLNNGALRIYRVNEVAHADEPAENGETPASPSKNSSKAVELLREEEKFSKKPVQQLAIVKEANLLVSLSDAYISLHDLQTYQLVDRLEKTKGAACFTVTSNVVKDSETGVPSLVSRLAVGVKRKVVCWTWQDMEQLPEAAEISLEASIKSLTWATGTKLIAGMDAGFSVVHIESEEVTPINKHASRTADSTAELAGVRFGAVSSSGMGYMGMGSWVPRPMATGLSEGRVLLAKDVNTLFTDTEGEALEKRQVPWSLAPEAMGYSYPYLLALQPPEKGALQIRNPDTLSLLQTLAVPNANILHVPQPNISLAHAGKGFLVASERMIWRMNALPYETQLLELVEKQRFDEAISLLKLLEDTLIDDKAGRIREIMMQKATTLFEQQKYLPALDLLTDAEAPPERVIALYPQSIAGDLSGSDTEKDRADHAADDGETKKGDATKEPPSTPSKSLLGRFTGGSSHARKESDTPSIKSSTKVEAETPSPHKAPTSIPAAGKPLEGEDLKVAVRCLLSFLAQARVQTQKYLNIDGTLKEDPPALDSETGKPAFANLLTQSISETDDKSSIDYQSALLGTAQLVDTTLFRSYMLARPSLAGPLFRLDNFCDPDVIESALYSSERYNDLIDFLHGKKLHRQALDMLAKFGKGEAEGEVPRGMQGPERTVAYLKQLPPELVGLVLEFAEWPIRAKPEVGMEVFVADTEHAERLPRYKVLSFLANIDGRLEVQYLEHIIDELGDETPDYHQQLVDLYLEELKSADLRGAERASVKERLEGFLRRSEKYNKTKTFRQLPADDPTLFEPRAIVLSAMGNHEQALSIYVFQIKDYEKAEDYCNRIFLTEQAEQQAFLIDSGTTHEKPPLMRSTTEVSKNQPNIFATLLALYLRPPAGEEKRWPQALDLLSRHGARLPASSTLSLMPDDLAVQELSDYFRGRIRHSTSLVRQEKIMRSLEYVKSVHTESLLLLGPDRDIEAGKVGGRNRRVRIGEEDHCKVCHKRFGASAVRVYPNGEVVHYGCVGKRAGDAGTSVKRRGWG